MSLCTHAAPHSMKQYVNLRTTVALYYGKSRKAKPPFYPVGQTLQLFHILFSDLISSFPTFIFSFIMFTFQNVQISTKRTR